MMAHCYNVNNVALFVFIIVLSVTQSTCLRQRQVRLQSELHHQQRSTKQQEISLHREQQRHKANNIRESFMNRRSINYRSLLKTEEGTTGANKTIAKGSNNKGKDVPTPSTTSVATPATVKNKAPSNVGKDKIVGKDPGGGTNGNETSKPGNSSRDGKPASGNSGTSTAGKPTNENSGTTPGKKGKTKSVIPLAPFTLELAQSEALSEETIVSVLIDYLKSSMKLSDSDTLTLRMKPTTNGRGSKGNKDTNSYKVEGSITLHYETDPGYPKSIQQSLLWRRQKAALVDDREKLEAALASAGKFGEVDGSGSIGESGNTTDSTPETTNSTSPVSGTVNKTDTKSSLSVVNVDMSEVVENGGGLTQEELTDNSPNSSNTDNGSTSSYSSGGNPDPLIAQQENQLILRNEILAMIVSAFALAVIATCCLLKLKGKQKRRNRGDDDEITADDECPLDLDNVDIADVKTSSMTPRQQYWAYLSRKNQPIRGIQISCKQDEEEKVKVLMGKLATDKTSGSRLNSKFSPNNIYKTVNKLHCHDTIDDTGTIAKDDNTEFKPVQDANGATVSIS